MEADRLWQKVVCFEAQNRCRLEHEGCTSMAYNGAHHLVPRKFQRFRIDPRNGFACCPSCHEWIEGHPKEFIAWLEKNEPETVDFILSAHLNYKSPTKEELDAQEERLRAYCRLHRI